MVTVDFYSNFWKLNYLPDPGEPPVIHKLKSHVALQGIPDVLISDNGLQF